MQSLETADLPVSMSADAVVWVGCRVNRILTQIRRKKNTEDGTMRPNNQMEEKT